MIPPKCLHVVIYGIILSSIIVAAQDMKIVPGDLETEDYFDSGGLYRRRSPRR